MADRSSFNSQPFATSAPMVVKSDSYPNRFCWRAFTMSPSPVVGAKAAARMEPP